MLLSENVLNEEQQSISTNLYSDDIFKEYDFFSNSNDLPFDDIPTEKVNYDDNKLLTKKYQRKTQVRTVEEMKLKKLERMRNNRISAQKSRDKKKNELIALKEMNMKLQEEILRLQKELEEKKKIIEILQQQGRGDNVCSVYLDTSTFGNDNRNETTSSDSSSMCFFVSSMFAIVCCLCVGCVAMNIYSNSNNNEGNMNQLRMLRDESVAIMELPYEDNITFIKEKFSEKALTGKCEHNDNTHNNNSDDDDVISVRVKHEPKVTDVVPFDYYNDKFIFDTETNSTFITLYHSSPNSTLTIKKLFEHIDNNFILLQNSPLINTSFFLSAPPPQYTSTHKLQTYNIYMNIILSIESAISYEFGCKVFDLTKHILN